jgi:ABC-type transport system involved in multi-copper enzyme maturation permease subunit
VAGAVRAVAIAGPVRAEFRKVASTKLWWGLLIPVALLSSMINLFGGVFTAAFPESERLPLLLGSLAYALGLTSVFAAVHGVVAAAGEFRHRTITTTYLTARGRTPVLLAKMLVSAGVGACYAVATVVTGVLAGAAADGGTGFPGAGPLAATALIGVAVTALWGALGAAFGTAVSNQVSALVALLLHLMVGELLVGALLEAAESDAVRSLSSYLPGNAGEVAVYGIPVNEIAGPATGPQVVELLAGVTNPPGWGVAVLVLTAWTAAVGAVAWLVSARRDIT